MQRSCSPLLSWIASWPILVARKTLSFSRAATVKPEKLGVIVGLPLKVGGLEGRVSDASCLDHGCPRSIVSAAAMAAAGRALP